MFFYASGYSRNFAWPIRVSSPSPGDIGRCWLSNHNFRHRASLFLCISSNYCPCRVGQFYPFPGIVRSGWRVSLSFYLKVVICKNEYADFVLWLRRIQLAHLPHNHARLSLCNPHDGPTPEPQKWYHVFWWVHWSGMLLSVKPVPIAWLLKCSAHSRPQTLLEHPISRQSRQSNLCQSLMLQPLASCSLYDMSVAAKLTRNGHHHWRIASSREQVPPMGVWVVLVEEGF